MLSLHSRDPNSMFDANWGRTLEEHCLLAHFLAQLGGLYLGSVLIQPRTICVGNGVAHTGPGPPPPINNLENLPHRLNVLLISFLSVANSPTPWRPLGFQLPENFVLISGKVRHTRK